MTAVLYNAYDYSYWVKCQISELPFKVIPNVSKEYADYLQKCCSDTSHPTEEEPMEFVYLLVNKDGEVIEPKDPYFPYTDLWHGECPFQVIKPARLEALSEVHQLLL